MRVWVENATGLSAAGERVKRFAGFAHVFFDRTDKPALTVVAERPVHFIVERSLGRDGCVLDKTKPPYRVPLMAEIAATPWNGFKVASMFAGCGGSSTGYRIAGFKVAFANEFIEAARDSYAANKDETTVLDGRDIRALQPRDVLDATGLAVGELDVLDGSPPCAAFSTAGKRQDSWGKVSKYSDGEQRSDDLFFEYARFVDGLKPKVFVAENVSGLVKGSSKGYFLDILKRLKSCGYRVEAKLLDAQWLGVPQMRQRLIFIGVRSDLDLKPAHPKPLAYRYSIRDALPWITAVAGGNKAPFDSKGKIYDVDEPSATVMGGDKLGLAPFQFEVSRIVQGNGNGYSTAGGKTVRIDGPAPTVVARGSRYSGATDQFYLEGAARAGAVNVKSGSRRSIDKPAPTVQTHGNAYTRSELTLEVAQDGGLSRIIEPESDISRFAIGKEWDRIGPGGQSEEYFQLVRPPRDEPSPTVTASGGQPSIASVVHPTEKRKFSIAELRRICGFPDDFVLTGTYPQQWERLGRAVPPVMMAAIAGTIRDEILAKLPVRQADPAKTSRGRA